jgi:hypothetical protein
MPSTTTQALVCPLAEQEPPLSPLSLRILSTVSAAQRPISSAMLAWALKLKSPEEWRSMIAELSALEVAGHVHQTGYPRAWAAGRENG